MKNRNAVGMWPLVLCGCVFLVCTFYVFRADSKPPMTDRELSTYVKSGRIETDFRKTQFAFFGMIGSLWLIGGLLPAFIAESKGHSFSRYFLAGLLVPGIVVVVAFLASPISKAEEEKQSRFSCPECGESISTTAKSCRFCNAIITQKDRPRLRARR